MLFRSRTKSGLNPHQAAKVVREMNEAMNAGIAYVPEDRHQDGLVLDFSIADNVTLPWAYDTTTTQPICSEE